MTAGEPTILMIGGTGAKATKYVAALKKRYQVRVARSGKAGILQAAECTPALIILNAVAMRTTGERICRDLKAAYPTIPVVYVHPGPAATAKSQAEALLYVPLSARRLQNTVDLLLNTNKEELLDYGPFRFNVTRRVLFAHGVEKQLTPKVASLIEIFMRNPGQTLPRKALMAQVWHTDYLGDTRTLDVHIRWVRDALENGNKKPVYLKTVRGVGYKLVLPENGNHNGKHP